MSRVLRGIGIFFKCCRTAISIFSWSWNSCGVSHVNSSILLPFLLQLIILWSRKRKGPVTGLSVQESSACTLSLFSSASSSAVAVLARPGAHTVRNVPFQEQVRGAQKTHTHAHTLYMLHIFSHIQQFLFWSYGLMPVL